MSSLKRLTEVVLARAGPAQWARRRHGGRTVVLAYHNVVTDGVAASGERSLHLFQTSFARQLDALERTHDVVSLESCLEPSDDSTRPRAALTFDDAYRGALEHGLEEVVCRGLPATVFVSPGLLGNRVTWWDRAAQASGGTLEPGLRERAIGEFGGEHDAVTRWLEQTEALGSLPEPASVSTSIRTASIDALTRAARMPGITLGAHGWSHVNLTSLDPPELRDELERPLRWLTDRFEAFVPWLSYPYGRYDPDVERAAAEAGYAGAVRLGGGWVPDGGRLDCYATPRVNIPAGVSLDGFALRVSGLLAS